MRKISLLIILSFILILSFTTVSLASDITITGSAHFKSTLSSKYMQKHGYSFIEEVRYENFLRKNIYAAGYAKVIIKNSKSVILGTVRTDENGGFSVTVPEEDSYQIVVRFHDHEFKKEVSPAESKEIIADLGDFSSNAVDGWIDARLASLR